jgi:hypothetical protein
MARRRRRGLPQRHRHRLPPRGAPGHRRVCADRHADQHGLLALKNLPPEHRAAWKAIFDYYIFNATRDQAAHIPEHRRGVLGRMSPELTQQLKAFLASQLQR